ncbi:MAG: CBS domain-containing protein [Candidatus Hadarchaeaceae archaeon]
MVNEKKPKEPTSPRKLMEIKVSEVMNKRPRVVYEDTPIEGLLESILGQIEECFPVVDKDFKLMGIVTESDLFQVLYPQIPSKVIGSSKIRDVMKYSAKTVGDIMTRRPITVTPGMSLREAMGLMASHKLRRLPVVEGSKLVGLLSLRNIIELYRIIR